MRLVDLLRIRQSGRGMNGSVDQPSEDTPSGEKSIDDDKDDEAKQGVQDGERGRKREDFASSLPVRERPGGIEGGAAIFSLRDGPGARLPAWSGIPERVPPQ